MSHRKVKVKALIFTFTPDAGEERFRWLAFVIQRVIKQQNGAIVSCIEEKRRQHKKG